MSYFFKFILVSAIIIFVADLIPFPIFPSGMIVYIISQYTQANQQK